MLHVFGKELDKNIAMASVRMTPASEDFAFELMKIMFQVCELDVLFVHGNDFVSGAIIADDKWVSPFRRREPIVAVLPADVDVVLSSLAMHYSHAVCRACISSSDDET